MTMLYGPAVRALVARERAQKANADALGDARGSKLPQTVLTPKEAETFYVHLLSAFRPLSTSNWCTGRIHRRRALRSLQQDQA